MYRIVNYKKIRTGLHRMLVITLLGSLSAFAWAQESVLKGRVVDVELWGLLSMCLKAAVLH